jgi:undecaprenyl-diphosphatase
VTQVVRDRVAWAPLAAAFTGVLALVAVGAVVQRSAGPDQLTVLGAVVLGVVEGLTEYLPVSSTGHLLVTGRILGLGGTAELDAVLETYAICIQFGAIAAVVYLYQGRLRQVTAGLVGRDDEGRRILLGLVAAFVPTVLIALAFGDLVRDRLFGAGPVAVAWILGGVAILALPAARRARPDAIGLESLVVRQAVLIGLAQAIALWPGVSRSLVTILAALAVGLTLSAAVEFSFLLGLITLGAATVFEAAQNGQDLIDTFGLLTPAIGLVVAFLAAVVAVRWMVDHLQRHGLEVFGWYRVTIGVLTLAAIGAGVL